MGNAPPRHAVLLGAGCRGVRSRRPCGVSAVLSLCLGAACLGAEQRWFGFNTYAPNAETLRHFAEAGVNTVVCFPANNLGATGVPYNNAYPPIWIGPGKYDFECLDRQVADKLAVNSLAKFIFFIDLNTPPWWCRIRGASNPDSFTQLGRLAASEVWRRDTSEYLRAVLEHLESRHRDVIIGYFLACGMTIEWQDFSRGEEGAIRREAWRRWMIKQGQPDPIDIPPASVRDHVSHGPFRDPVEDAMAIQYWKFSHALIGETILHFAGAAQEVIKHRVPLGLCYGYIMEHGKGRLLYEGHLDFDRVYASPDLDWFISPGSYHDRQIGGGAPGLDPASWQGVSDEHGSPHAIRAERVALGPAGAWPRERLCRRGGLHRGPPARILAAPDKRDFDLLV